jgi:predicted transcriptional regulator
MTVGKVCNRQVTVVDLDESIEEAVNLMRRHHVGDVVVTRRESDGIKPVGILTDRDIVIEVLAEEVSLSAVGIKDVMSSELLTSTESDSIFDTIKRMRTKGVRRMPVVDSKGCLVGIFTLDDAIDMICELLGDVVGTMKSGFNRERRKLD